MFSKTGTLLAFSGSNTSNFLANSVFPISIALCAISVYDKPFKLDNLIKNL